MSSTLFRLGSGPCPALSGDGPPEGAWRCAGRCMRSRWRLRCPGPARQCQARFSGWDPGHARHRVVMGRRREPGDARGAACARGGVSGVLARPTFVRMSFLAQALTVRFAHSPRRPSVSPAFLGCRRWQFGPGTLIRLPASHSWFCGSLGRRSAFAQASERRGSCPRPFPAMPGLGSDIPDISGLKIGIAC